MDSWINFGMDSSASEASDFFEQRDNCIE